jgi:hypothetical protein
LFQAKKKPPSVVLIFVHGGIGIVANKETYNLMGRNAARGRYRYTGLYSFKPFADYDTMTKGNCICNSMDKRKHKEVQWRPEPSIYNRAPAGDI